MDSIVKRSTSGLLAIWFLLFSLISPIQATAATYSAASNLTGKSWYVPAAGTGVAGSAVLASAATLLGRANPWIAALTIGTPIMQQLLEMRNNGNVSIGSDPANFPTPPGWTNSDTPPATAAQSSQAPFDATALPAGTHVPATANYHTGTINSPTFNCALFVTDYPKGPCQDIEPTYTTTGQCGRHFANAYCSNTPIYKDPTCPSGWTLSGAGASAECISTLTTYTCPDGLPVIGGKCYPAPGCPPGYSVNYDSCILTNNALPKWPDTMKDNVVTYVPDPANSGKFKVNPRDPDTLPINATNQLTDAQVIADLQNSSQTFTKDEFGNPTMTQVQANPQGGYTFNQQVQTTNNNQTYTTTNTYTTNKQGEVINISTVTNNGPITNVSSTPATKIDFPDDYNREATQQKILSGADAPNPPDWATDIQAKTDDQKQKIDDKLNEIPGQFQADKDSWFSWVWTPPVGQCSPFTGSVHGKSVNWNLCPYIENIRDIIGWMFAIAGTWLIYNELFKRES